MSSPSTQAAKQIAVFTDKYPLVGPSLWIASLQFFIVMVLVALAWPVHYSVLHNTISDLGNTACGLYDGRAVCSPDFNWMNASLIVLGLTMLSGSTLIYQEFKETDWSWPGFAAMAAAGIGTAIVGLAPENTIKVLHEFGAILPFVVGNIGMVILGYCLDLPRPLKIYTIASGLISLAAFGFFITHHYLGIGIGGMERLTAHLQTIWLIVFGFYISSDRYQSAKHAGSRSRSGRLASRGR